MKNMFKLSTGIVLLTLVFSSIGWCQSTADIVLIIDSSGSMDDNDPRGLRKSAANLFIGLAASDVQTDVQIGVVDFDSAAVTNAPLTLVNPAGRAQLEQAVGQIDSNGGTDIRDGLRQGFEVLSAANNPDVRKAAVLLTDGQDSSYTDQIVSNYDAKGWSIYTIGLGSGVDRGRLQNIAAGTPEGEYYQVDLSKIQEIYNKILAKITRKSILSSLRGFMNQDQQITKNVFIDRTVGQVDFSASWTGSTIEMVLIDPSGSEITPDVAATLGVGYQVAPTFVIYTVNNPMAGEWGMKIKGTDIPPEGEPYSLVVTGTSDFTTNFLAFETSYSIGDTIRIGIRASEQTGDTSQPVLGATTSADVVRPDGRIETLNLFDDGLHNDNAAGDGVYASNYTNVDLLGTYLIRAAAQNGFSREIEQQIIVGNIDNVFVDGSTLTPAAGSTLSQPPSLIRAVISGPAGRIDSDSIRLKLDGAIVQHTYDRVNQIVSVQPSNLSSGEHTVSISVNNTIETQWAFIIEAIADEAIAELRFAVVLEQGLNIISVPLMPEAPYTAKTLGEMIGATTVIRFDTVAQAYFAYVMTDITDGFTIQGGQGYIVNVPTSKTVTFTGTAWQNPPVTAAPTLGTKTSVWAFVVSSDLRGMDTTTRYTLTAKNLNTGTEAGTATSDNPESLKAVWVDLNRNSVVQIGDTLELTLYNDDGTIVAGPIQQTVSHADVYNAYMKVQLTVGDVQPRETLLAQNYPNPFNPETWIPYQLHEPTAVSVQIYDSTGRSVRTLDIGLKAAGNYMRPSRAAYWDGKNDMGERVASGIYFYTLQTPEFSATRRMVILK